MCMNQAFRQHRQAGISLIEVVFSVTIISIALIFIGYTVTLFVQVRHEMRMGTQALYLAEEGYELIRAIRNDSWSTIDALTLDTKYTFNLTTTTIAISSIPEIIDGEFNRVFEVRELYRNGDDDVVASTTPGSASDDEAREVIVRVGYGYGTTTLRSVITNIFVE